MEKDIKNIELKIYRKLYELNSAVLRTIISRAQDRIEYRDRVHVEEKEKRDIELMESIANKEKWDYYGICNNDKIKLMEFLEYLLDDKA